MIGIAGSSLFCRTDEGRRVAGATHTTAFCLNGNQCLFKLLSFKKKPFRIPFTHQFILNIFSCAYRYFALWKTASRCQILHADAVGVVAGEASASTMWDNQAWSYLHRDDKDTEPPFLAQDFIHAVQPEARIIIMLRDPVERWNKHLLTVCHSCSIFTGSPVCVRSQAVF